MLESQACVSVLGFMLFRESGGLNTLSKHSASGTASSVLPRPEALRSPKLSTYVLVLGGMGKDEKETRGFSLPTLIYNFLRVFILLQL